jgi:hypothetical protein
VAFVDQVWNANTFSEREAVFARELEHVLHGMAAITLLPSGGLRFS